MADPTTTPVATPTDADINQTKLLEGVVDGINSGYESAKMHLTEMGPALLALTVASKAYSGPLYEQFVAPFIEASQQPGILASKITGAGIGMVQNYQVQSKEIMESAERSRQYLLDQSNQAVIRAYDDAGKVIAEKNVPLTTFYKNAAQLGAEFYKTVLDESRLQSAGIKALAKEDSAALQHDVDLAAKGLGLSTEAIRAMMQEEFSKTGSITGDAMRKYESTILAAEKVTGLSSKAISADMNRMLVDVNNFGNLTPDKLAALSATIHQLGLDIDDVTKLADKFSSFESATQAISNLNAITGATLDTTEMFYLANEDKDEFLKQMRQSLLDQGVAIENLSFQEQKALASSLGIGVRQLESFLNPMMDFTEFSAAAIEEQSNNSQFQAGELKKALQDMGEVAVKALAALTPEGIAEAQKATAQLAGASQELAKSYRDFGINLASITSTNLPAMADAGVTANKSIVAAFEGGIATFERVQAAIDETTKKAEAAAEKLSPKPATPPAPAGGTPTATASPPAAATPTPPAVEPVAPPVPTVTPPVTAPGTTGTAGPTASTTVPQTITLAAADDATVRVKFDLDTSSLNKLIDARIIEATDGGITATPDKTGIATTLKLAVV